MPTTTPGGVGGNSTSLHSHSPGGSRSSLTCWTLYCASRRKLFFNLVVVGLLGIVCFALLTQQPRFTLATAVPLSAPVVIATNTCSTPLDNDNKHNFRRPNAVITEYDVNVAQRLATLVERKATAADDELLRLIRDMMDPPSNHMVKMSRQLFETPQSREADAILNRKRGGFFIECGGFDGERASNTLWLERQRGWTGLLVEMDPYFYTQLLGKSRQCYSINACISPHSYVTQQVYVESSGGAGELAGESSRQQVNTKLVPCFPLDALLAALNQSTVDYFSLDVEGFELEILRTIPFDQLDIRVLSVEYVHGKTGKQAYVDFMAEHGYVVHRDIHFHDQPQTIFVDDFIFVKKQ